MQEVELSWVPLCEKGLSIKHWVHTETRKEKFMTFDPIFCDLIIIDRKREPLTTRPVKTMSEMLHWLNILMFDTKFPKFLKTIVGKIWNSMTIPWTKQIILISMNIFAVLECKFKISRPFLYHLNPAKVSKGGILGF